jgi:hypothetical protein
MHCNANPDLQAIQMMITHVPENLKPCEKRKKLEDLVPLITHDPENLNPCEKEKKYRGFSCSEHP